MTLILPKFGEHTIGLKIILIYAFIHLFKKHYMSCVC